MRCRGPGPPPRPAARARSHRRAPASGTSRRTRLRRPAATSHPATLRATASLPGTPGASHASLPGPAGIVPPAPAAGLPRRSTRRRRPGGHRRGAIRPGHAQRARAQRAPGAQPRQPTLTAGPSGQPQRREQAPVRALGRRARPYRRGPGTPGGSPRRGQLADVASGRYLRSDRGSEGHNDPPGLDGAGSPGRSAGQARHEVSAGRATLSGGSGPSAGPDSGIRTRPRWTR